MNMNSNKFKKDLLVLSPSTAITKAIFNRENLNNNNNNSSNFKQIWLSLSRWKIVCSSIRKCRLMLLIHNNNNNNSNNLK